MLENQQRFLDADGGQQHEMRHPRALCRLQRQHMRVVIDRPGILGRPRARGHAGHHRIETLASKAVAGERDRIAHVDAPDLGETRQPGPRRRHTTLGRPLANERDHLVAALHERGNGRPTDGPRRSEHADPETRHQA